MLKYLLIILTSTLTLQSFSQFCRFQKKNAAKDSTEQYWVSSKIPMASSNQDGISIKFYKTYSRYFAKLTTNSSFKLAMHIEENDTLTIRLEDQTVMQFTPIKKSDSSVLALIFGGFKSSNFNIELTQSDVEKLANSNVAYVGIQYTDFSKRKLKMELWPIKKYKDNVRKYANCLLKR
jgi:hypothetical protein